MQIKQRTLKQSYTFTGKGLHTGRQVTMIVTPAPENHGIKFQRTDLEGQPVMDAIVDYVTSTERGTTLEHGEMRISTIEHILSALAGLGVDNALILLDGSEAPILDG
ncbi:MAG TPA: UDP-3-O-acyl-N-acetylglucosamine deacetylase, partial [Bacteroidales bacterium]|nr:UDP-3-O-acyl-N-acetylglucosamine deacetylase [Bacteroidales bacterium]